MASLSTAAAEPSSRLRAYARIAGLVLFFFACIPFHLLARYLTGRSRWPRRFMRGAAAICGADVRCEGEPVAPHTLLVANHCSWLDIPVLIGATGCALIAKAEMRGNAFVRWFADQNATIYVDRAERRAVHGQAAAIAEGLQGAQPLALFPEGTVSDGSRLLPFKPSLLSVVAPPPESVVVRPVAIDYGKLAPAIGWAGERGVDNALRVLGRKGRIPVTVRLLAPLDPQRDRKALARAAHDAIAAALAPSGIAPAGV